MCLEYWFTIDLIDRTENFAEMHLSRGFELKVSTSLPSYIELCWRIISMYFNVLSMLKIPNLHELCVPPPFPSVYIHTLQWRHNELDDVSNHQPYDCLLNRLFRRRSTKTSKLHVTGLCAGNSPVSGEFPAQRAINTENVSIWWRHHDMHPHTTDSREHS